MKDPKVEISDDSENEMNETDPDTEQDEDVTSTVQTDKRRSGIVVDMMVNTNLIRTNEVLAFLNDKTRSSNEKRLALKKASTSALFWAVRERAEDRLIEKMLEYGGMELVIVTNFYNENVLHYAAYIADLSTHVVKKLADIGGRDAILHQDRFGNSAFYCGKFHLSGNYYPFSSCENVSLRCKVYHVYYSNSLSMGTIFGCHTAYDRNCGEASCDNNEL